MYCGKIGIEDYISINEFRAENLKSIILNKKNTLFNKNKSGNKISSVLWTQYVRIWMLEFIKRICSGG
jgi:hypothetical protein